LAKVYLITDKDIEDLKVALDRNPVELGRAGLTEVERAAHERIFRHLNYHICEWISHVTK